MSNRILAIAVASALLTGCVYATAPLNSTQPLPPPSQIYDQSFATPNPESGALVITRDKGITASACTFDVSIDGKRAMGLRSGEQGTAYVAPGERVIGVRSGCGIKRYVAQTAVTLQAGDRKRLRVGVRESMDLFIEQSVL